MRYKSFAAPVLGGVVAVAAFASSMVPVSAHGHGQGHGRDHGPSLGIPSDVLADLTSPAIHLVDDAKWGVFSFVADAAEDVHELAGETLEHTVHYAAGTVGDVKDVADDNLGDVKHLVAKAIDNAKDVAGSAVEGVHDAAGIAVGDAKAVAGSAIPFADHVVDKTVDKTEGVAGGEVAKVDDLTDDIGASASARPDKAQVSLPLFGASLTACAAVSAGE